MVKYLLTLFLALPYFVFADNILEENFSQQETENARIQILNKITAKTQYVEAPINSQVTFGTIKIIVLRCLKSSPYDPPENKILLDISEKKNGQTEYNNIFSGWMFSNSPSISSLEHAVYDVTAINCYN